MKISFHKDKPSFVVTIIVVIAVLIIGLAAYHDHQSTINAPKSPALPTAVMARVTREDLYKKITIPAEFRPYMEAELNAKVSGYVDQMNVDFGDKVKTGELLAVLMVPELAAQLTNAIAAEEKTEADYTNANLIYTRMMTVDKEHPNLVAQQDIDTAAANNQAAYAAIAAARAEVERYRTLVSYTRITAPFDGIVTWRYADPGALIQAGTSSDSQSLPLVRVSDNYLLRLDFPVSVDDVQYMRVGDPVQVQIGSLDGETFTEKITRFTDKVDESTRTMMVEVEVPNTNLKIVPGMYATVVLEAEKHANALAIPVEAVTGAQNNSVMVINADKQIEARTVTLGIETPDKYEVLSGLKEGEAVMVGNPSHLQPGQKVEALAASLPGEQ